MATRTDDVELVREWLLGASSQGGGPELLFGMLAGAWDGERSADTWRWLIICLSVDAMLGAGALALAAVPIVALEALALGMDLTKLTRKVGDGHRVRAASATLALT